MTEAAVDVDFDSKYGHLTRPLKEAALCWDIDLEDVIETFLSKENEDPVSMDPAHMMNFAQAGMLVSSTAMNYGRKVEHLYSLVYSTLDSLSKGEGKSLATSALMKKMRKRIVGFQEFENGFELLDEQFKQPARGIDLNASDGLSNGSHITRRVPLLLLPREESAEKEAGSQKQSSNGTEFKTSGCFVSETGCLLLDPGFKEYEDWDKLGQGGRGSMGGRVSMKGPLVPGAISQVEDQPSATMIALPSLTSMAEEIEPVEGFASPIFDQSPEHSKSPETLPSPVGLFPALGKRSRAEVLPLPEEESPLADPFAELDPHAVSSGRNIKMKVGKCHITPPDLKNLMELSDGLQTRNVFESKTDLFGPCSDLLCDFKISDIDPRDKLPLVNFAPFTHFKSPFEVELREIKRKAALAERERRKEELKRRNQDAFLTSESETEETGDTLAERRFSVLSSGRQSLAGPLELDEREVRKISLISSRSREEKALQVERERMALLEKVLESSKNDYDELMRRNLLEMNSNSASDDSIRPSVTSSAIVVSEKIPELYANIRKWQDNLEPLLEEQSSRPVFDLDDYLVSIIGKLKEVVAPTVDQDCAISEFLRNAGVADLSDDEDKEEEEDFFNKEKKGPASSFESLVKGEPKWNVCRLFLSTLILTNNGNVEIFNQEGQDELEQAQKATQAETMATSPTHRGGSPLRGSHTFGASQSFQVKLRNADKNLKFAIQDNAAVVTGIIPILTNKDVPAPEPVGDVPFIE
jgi:hypothetical protein